MGKVHDGLKCLLCGDIIFSEYTHDFKSCSCDNCFVDGGYSYGRYGFNDPSTIVSVHRDEDGNITEII
jgi:hypothetical protein